MGETTASLRAAFDAYNALVGYATLLVVAGIAGELLVLLIFSKDMGVNEKVSLFLVNVVILLGCGGEFWFGRAAANIAGELQNRASVKTAALNKEAAAAQLGAAQARLRAAEAERRAAQIQLTLTKLEAPRTVTPAQQRIILAALKTAPKGPISVVTSITDETDAKSFSASIRSTLVKAGYRVVPAQGKLHIVLSWSAPGAFLVVHNLRRAPAYAADIQRAFGHAGILLIGVGKPNYVASKQVVIVVSSHPFFVQRIPMRLR